MEPAERKNVKYSMLLGLGFDNHDGHVRITTGRNFKLIGGSRETHEVMQDTALKFNKELDKRKKNLAEINREELLEIAEEIGLRQPK